MRTAYRPTSHEELASESAGVNYGHVPGHQYHIEVWYDETSDCDDPLYCVSLCEEGGKEVKCLSTHEDREEADDAGRVAARERNMDALYRTRRGETYEL